MARIEGRCLVDPDGKPMKETWTTGPISLGDVYFNVVQPTWEPTSKYHQELAKWNSAKTLAITQAHREGFKIQKVWLDTNGGLYFEDTLFNRLSDKLRDFLIDKIYKIGQMVAKWQE